MPDHRDSQSPPPDPLSNEEQERDQVAADARFLRHVEGSGRPALAESMGVDRSGAAGHAAIAGG